VGNGQPEQRPFLVSAAHCARLLALGQQHLFNIGLEGLFGGLGHAQSLPGPSVTLKQRAAVGQKIVEVAFYDADGNRQLQFLIIVYGDIAKAYHALQYVGQFRVDPSHPGAAKKRHHEHSVAHPGAPDGSGVAPFQGRFAGALNV
jgi:hypothetical protein